MGKWVGIAIMLIAAAGAQAVDFPSVDAGTQACPAEQLDRGVVAFGTLRGVYVGWRLLKTDSADAAFDVYRSQNNGTPEKLNARPVSATTDFLDETLPDDAENVVYTVCPAGTNAMDGDSASLAPSAGIGPSSAAVLSFDLHDSQMVFERIAFADLNGDEKLDYIIRGPVGYADPGAAYWNPSTNTYLIEAYLNDGTYLWTRDMGWSIERGPWYSPYIAADLNGDGKAEVIAKTGEGDPRDPDGKVTSGPEWLSIWDGMTGAEITKVAWPSRDGFLSYNYFSRNQLAVACLDGTTPCVIALRGTYNLMKADAWQLNDGQLEPLWSYNNANLPLEYKGQGEHFTHAADVDGDGRDEVMLGSVMLDDTGDPLWTTGLGHNDSGYITDVLPDRPGLEIYYNIETSQPSNGMCLVDAQTGSIIWGFDQPTAHIHGNGMCADIDPFHPGMECWGADSTNHEVTVGPWLWSADGNVLAFEDPTLPGTFDLDTVFWDADLQKEYLSGKLVTDFQGGFGDVCLDGRIIMIADIMGDWREEIITSMAGRLYIYSTTIPAMDRRVCLMQDSIYRADVRMDSMGYRKLPSLSYCPSAESPNVNLTVLSEQLHTYSCRAVVSAPLGSSLAGILSVTGCSTQFDVHLNPGEIKTFEMQVPKANVAGNAFLAAELQTAGGSLCARVPTERSIPEPEIDFTAAEGYADGPLSYNAGWIGYPAFSVDSANGLLTMQSLVNNSRIYNTGNLRHQSAYTVGIKFSFDRTVADVSNQNVLGVLLSDASADSERFEMIMQRTGGGGTGAIYRLRCNHSGSVFTTLGLGGGDDESALGFGAGDDRSDDLWLSMTLTRGADTDSWIVSGVLSNLTTGVEIDSSSATWHTGPGFFAGNVFGGLTGCYLESSTQTSNRNIDKFVAYGIPEPVPALPDGIDFTSEEGYSNDQLANHADWNGYPAFLVDSTAGTLAMQSVVNNSRIYNTENLRYQSGYTVGMKFSFDRTVADVSNQNVLGVLLSDASADSERFEMIMQRTGGGGTGAIYRLRCNHQDSVFTTLGLTAGINESVLGFGTGDDRSDDLWLSMTLTRGADTNSWTVSGVLSNLTTGAEIDSFSTSWHTGLEFFIGNVYGGLAGCSLEPSTQTSNRNIDHFVAYGIPAPVNTLADVIDFTFAEGYGDGQLDNHADWNGYAAFSVDSMSGILAMQSVVNNPRIYYSGSLDSALSYTAGIRFSFNRAVADISNQNVLGVLLSDADTDSERFEMIVQRTGGGGTGHYYRLRCNHAGSVFTTLGLGGGDNEAALGFGDGDDLSDDLWLGMTLIPGADANSWVVTGVLSNLTTGVLVDSYSTSWHTGLGFFSGNIYGGLTGCYLESATQVSNRNIDQFILSSTHPRAVAQFEAWTRDFGLVDMDALSSADPDGDGFSNLMEYGLGGTPTSRNDSIRLPEGFADGNLFHLTHVALSDPECGIGYVVETTTNLASGVWTTRGITAAGGSLDDTFNTVTNTISADGTSAGFMRLRIVDLP